MVWSKPSNNPLTEHPKVLTARAQESLGDHLDMQTFEQILEMDNDEDDREFSRSIVYGFFEQAETSFAEMEEAMWVLSFFTQLHLLEVFLRI